jgi:hypothetical protein
MVAAPNIAPMLADLSKPVIDPIPQPFAQPPPQLKEADTLQAQIHRLLRDVLASTQGVAAAADASAAPTPAPAPAPKNKKTTNSSDHNGGEQNKDNVGNNYAPIFEGDTVRADVASHVRSARQDNDNDNDNNNNNDNNNDSSNRMQTGSLASLSEGGAIVMLTGGQGGTNAKTSSEESPRLVLADSRTTHHDNWQVVVNVNLNLNVNSNDNVNRLEEKQEQK